MTNILIVDDDSTICMMLKAFLSKKQYDVETAFSAGEALKKTEESKFDLVLCDFRLPDFDGLELLQKIKANNANIAFVMMTSYADIKTAVKAVKLGAYEYVAKPLNPDEIVVILNAALEKNSNIKKAPVSKKKKFDFVKGTSSSAMQIDQYIKLVAPTDMSVIIEGESGTGKEIAARRIHNESKRKDKHFVAVDCGALSNELAGSELFGHIKGSFTGAMGDKEGQFEYAKGGTLFLDEIGNLSYEIQIKLLRAIQERKIRRIGSNKDIDVDVRIVTATNEHLSKEVSNGLFREDLYHRLNEFTITVPALRDRNTDIVIFADYFLKLSNAELAREVRAFSTTVLDKFKQYSWPGNIRELRNVIRRAVLLTVGDEVEVISLPSEILNYNAEKNTLAADETNLKLVQADRERELIITTLQKVDNNKSKAARMLNIDRKTLYNKLKQYDIDL